MSGGQAVVTDQSITSRMVALTASQVDVATSETTTSTSYANLTTTGPAVTLSPGVAQNHLLLVKHREGEPAGNGVYVSVAINGATALDQDGGRGGWNTTSMVAAGTGSFLLAASQPTGATHTTKYKTGGGTLTSAERRLIGWCA